MLLLHVLKLHNFFCGKVSLTAEKYNVITNSTLPHKCVSQNILLFVHGFVTRSLQCKNTFWIAERITALPAIFVLFHQFTISDTPNLPVLTGHFVQKFCLQHEGNGQIL